MGLGKTVQTIALLSHLAEARGIWGPFLIVSPTSTLPNWANEIQKFAPKFNVIPYWGNSLQRKTLRRVMDPKYLHRPESPCHVVVTSYNLVVLDKKFFSKLRWEYLILDEAHAIKNASSVRWNTLLGFSNCRNRLLLTGTPIQNSTLPETPLSDLG
jgi:chromatin-remodeling ATPase INO80